MEKPPASTELLSTMVHGPWTITANPDRDIKPKSATYYMTEILRCMIKMVANHSVRSSIG